MGALQPWLGDLYQIDSISRETAGVISLISSVVCGAVVGMERERRDKPAGTRTVILICVGSTIFTMASLLLSSTKGMADPARIASQIVPGIGFLGAGAIIQLRGSVLGLTTAATIWTVAAVGIVIGAGYVAAGISFTLIIMATLSLFRRVEAHINGPCERSSVVVRYRTQNGKTLPRIRGILDSHQMPDHYVRFLPADSEQEARLSMRYCTVHREHRGILRDLGELEEVVAIEDESAPVPVTPAEPVN